ncbi:hypothetical protein ACGC1H_003297 [Rhizoctonia solani]
MPANSKIDRVCECTPCKQTPKGFRIIKYSAWYRHQTAEKALQERRIYQAALRYEADAFACSNIQGPEQPQPQPQPILSPGPSQLEDLDESQPNMDIVEQDEETSVNAAEDQRAELFR